MDKVIVLQTEIIGWYDNLVIEHEELMDERDKLCKKIENDLETILYEFDYFLKSYKGFGFQNLE